MQINIDLMPVLFQTFYQPNLDLKTYKSQDTNENCQDCFISKITSSRSLKFLANLKGRYQDKQIAECVIKKMQPSYFSGRFYFYSVIAVDKTSNAQQAEFQAQPVKKNPLLMSPKCSSTWSTKQILALIYVLLYSSFSHSKIIIVFWVSLVRKLETALSVGFMKFHLFLHKPPHRYQMFASFSSNFMTWLF